MEYQNECSVGTSAKPNQFNGFPPTAKSTSSKDVENIKESEVNAEGRPCGQTNLPALMKVFQDIYDQKLNAIEKNINLDRNEKNQEKLAILQQYIQQLLEQNDTFMNAMIELETEAQQRVKQMEKRLKSSAKTTMEAALNIHECEKEMRRLVGERLYIESLYKDMQQHLSTIKVENCFLRDQNFNLHHDVQALLHVIQHARSTGHWEMNCVTFCEVTPEQVFGPVQSISTTYTSESPPELHPYESERKTSVNSDISSHEATDSSTSSPYVAFPLRNELKEADTHVLWPFNHDNSHNEISEKSNTPHFATLLAEHKHELSMKDAERECHLWKMEMLTQQHKSKVQNTSKEFHLSNISLPKCISLPEIGNIYSFSYALRKRHSFDFGNAETLGIKLFHVKHNNSVRTSHVDNGSDFQNCKSVHKKTNRKSCIRRGQSEPHLFMFGDSIYVYRPCEPIKKASNIALHDDYDINLPPCQSIDLKFPTENSNTKICDWTSFDKRGSYTTPDKSLLKDDDSTSSGTCSDPEIESYKKNVSDSYKESHSQKSSSVQTDNAVMYSVGLQAALKRDDDSSNSCSCFDPGVERFDKKVLTELLKENASFSSLVVPPVDTNGVKAQDVVQENCALQNNISQMVNVIQILKENLVKAEDKAQAKEMLISQLQGHLVSSVKEVEMKDMALKNLEKKLDLSRGECVMLKQKISDSDAEIQRISKSSDDSQMLIDNLKLKADAKEEKFEEIMSEQKVLQEQKRALMIQLDAQGDELERTKEELEITRQKAESYSLQMAQQSQIIRNLQDALVQSKRAFDAAHQKIPVPNSTSASNSSGETKNASKTSIVNI